MARQIGEFRTAEDCGAAPGFRIAETGLRKDCGDLVTVFLGCGLRGNTRKAAACFPFRCSGCWVTTSWSRCGLARAFAGHRGRQNGSRAHRDLSTPPSPVRLGENFCLLHQSPANDVHDLAQMRCVGMLQSELRKRLNASNTLLNLSYSIHPPFLLEFERRIFCDLDPSEIFFG